MEQYRQNSEDLCLSNQTAIDLQQLRKGLFYNKMYGLQTDISIGSSNHTNVCKDGLQWIIRKLVWVAFIWSVVDI